MAEPEVPAETTTAPPPEASGAETQAAEAGTQDTPTLTREDVQALIEQTWTERETNIRKDLEAAYKTLRRGEAKTDTAAKRIDKLEAELFDVSLRGLDPQQIEIERLKRDAQSRTQTLDPNAEAAAFREWSLSYLEEEGIDPKDPVLMEAFQRYAEGWNSGADLRIGLTKAVAAVLREREKQTRGEAAERERKAREEERAKARNERRQEEGKIDKGAPAGPAARASKSVLDMPPEEWEAFKATRRR